MSHRRSLLLLAFALAACEPPTAPGTDPDVDQWPYRLSPQGMRIFGTSRVLVILAPYADGLPEPYSSSAMRQRLFGGSTDGPVTETFRLASGGSFTLRADVTPWYRSSLTVAAARGPGVITTSGEWDYVIGAIQAADPGYDFGRYDNEGPDGIPNSGDDDGIVDGGIVLLNSELNAYCNAGTGRGPHPHAVTRWKPNGQPYPTLDARTGGGTITVGGYTVMSATGCTSTSNPSSTLAHELGHLLFGLPDLYQPFGVSPTAPWSVRRWVVGCWDLMAAGSGWGCGAGTPASNDGRIGALGAFTRALIGWVEPAVVAVDREGSFDLFPLGRGGTVLRLPIRENEYLLVEYREPGPGDGLPPAAGVLVYHVIDTLKFFPPTPAGWSRVNLIEADDDSALTRTELEGGNRGVAGDAFGASRTELRPGQHPRFVALDGSPLPFALSEISINAPVHRARVRVTPVAPSLISAPRQ